MSIQPVARRYAKALFELAVESSALEKFTAEIKSVADAVTQSPDLLAVLTNPAVLVHALKAIMEQIADRLGVSPVVKNAVLLITDHNRASALPRIAAALTELADESAGKLRADVSSAVPLTDAQYGKLTATLEKITGRKISLVKKTDPSLIGGVVTRIGDKVYDGSVKSRLEEIRLSLLPS
ncbi:MAG: ATP synthase F1 subunit delta [Deltaproteobacteria bacterium]